MYNTTTQEMDIPTNTEIINISNVVQGQILHPTTAAYIQTLLTDYALAVANANKEQIIQWIPLAIGGKSGDDLLEFLATAADTNTVEFVRNIVIRFVVERMSICAGDIAAQLRDKTILPWDLQKCIANNDELFPIVIIDRDENILPVTVTVNGQQFTHMLTEEFTMGLLLFSDPLVGNIDFNITLFGTPFTSEYIIQHEADDEETNRFTRPDHDTTTWYSVEINYTIYSFDTPDFMQGFATGAMWAGVDHHNYWTHLFQNINVRPGEYTGTPINF